MVDREVGTTRISRSAAGDVLLPSQVVIVDASGMASESRLRWQGGRKVVRFRPQTSPVHASIGLRLAGWIDREDISARRRIYVRQVNATDGLQEARCRVYMLQPSLLDLQTEWKNMASVHNEANCQPL